MLIESVNPMLQSITEKKYQTSDSLLPSKDSQLTAQSIVKLTIRDKRLWTSSITLLLTGKMFLRPSETVKKFAARVSLSKSAALRLTCSDNSTPRKSITFGTSASINQLQLLTLT